MRQVRRILYVRTDRIGDVLMNLPAIGVIRRNYPKVFLTLLVDRSVAGLLDHHPDLDEIMTIDVRQIAERAAARCRLLNKIRAARYDLAIISNPSKFFHWLSFACGIPLRVGWRRKWSFFLNRTLDDRKTKGLKHEIDANLSLVYLVCRERWDGTVRLVTDEKTTFKIRGLLDEARAGKQTIVIHTGTSNPEKRWPKENFIKLCRRIQERGAGFLTFIGAEEETAVAQEIISHLRYPALDLTGKTSLRELVALFLDARVRALVSSDSGPVHVAWMSGKPVAAFYASNVPGSDPARWGPRDQKSEVIFKAMNEITAEEAFERLERVLAHG